MPTPSTLRRRWAAIPGVTYPAATEAEPAEYAEYVAAAHAAAVLQTETRHLARYTKTVHRIRYGGIILYNLADLTATPRFAEISGAYNHRPAETVTEAEAAAILGLSRTGTRQRIEKAALPFTVWLNPARRYVKLYAAAAIRKLKK